jgi:hypothetical protein
MCIYIYYITVWVRLKSIRDLICTEWEHIAMQPSSFRVGPLGIVQAFCMQQLGVATGAPGRTRPRVNIEKAIENGLNW